MELPTLNRGIEIKKELDAIARTIKALTLKNEPEDICTWIIPKSLTFGVSTDPFPVYYTPIMGSSELTSQLVTLIKDYCTKRKLELEEELKKL